MKIKKILSQNRRDLTAIYICEHCDAECTGNGYDDKFFHENIIPEMVCEECKKTSPETYMPETTKYPEGYQI